MMAVGAKAGCSVGDVCTVHGDDVRKLIAEMEAAASKVVFIVFLLYA